jgi:hypothetical protein
VTLPARYVVALTCFVASVVAGALALRAQNAAPVIPAMFANIKAGADGQPIFQVPGGDTYTLRERAPNWTLDQLQGAPKGTPTGIALDFRKPGFAGTLVWGLVPYADTKYPQPVYRTSTAIKDGKAEIDLAGRVAGVYDMVGWAKSGTGVIGYRIITNEGAMVYDGRVRFKGTGPFETVVTMLNGPFVAKVTPRSAVIWFELSQPASCSVTVGTRTVACVEGRTRQELLVDGLAPSTDYAYTVRYDAYSEQYGLRTAPRAGSRVPFTFSYSSDSRGGQGGGDRNFNGPNAYIMRRSVALARQRNTAFMLFTGDLIGGPHLTPAAMNVEFANWYRAVEPHAHWMPIVAGIGNHEAVVREFVNEKNQTVRVDRFPYDTESTEATFAAAFVNPENGPASEDGSAYDPNPNAVDYPSYRETVFSFTHANAGFAVLNSNYWYSPTMGSVASLEGNPHAYVMDNQLAWLKTTLDAFEKNATVDHVFVTIHTPVFPNGGHVGDDMWYGGKNDMRARVNGQPVAKGILERRDEILALIQQHPKVVAVLTGDEHNYNRLRLDATVPIYPDGWTGPRVTLKRPFFQVNNGAAGAPYYAQDKTPWSAFVKGFSTQHALCLFQINGPRVTLETVNPETLEVLDRAVLR